MKKSKRVVLLPGQFLASDVRLPIDPRTVISSVNPTDSLSMVALIQATWPLFTGKAIKQRMDSMRVPAPIKNRKTRRAGSHDRGGVVRVPDAGPKITEAQAVFNPATPLSDFSVQFSGVLSSAAYYSQTGTVFDRNRRNKRQNGICGDGNHNGEKKPHTYDRREHEAVRTMKVMAAYA